MQTKHQNIEYCIELNDFVERYNKSVGIICREYIGKHLVIYSQKDNKKDMYDVINSLSEIKEPLRVKGLYIDGLVITDRKVFLPFKYIERIHGVPILEITNMSLMFNGCNSLKSVKKLGKWDMHICTEMYGMFCGCESLTDIGDLGGWDTSSVTGMGGVFVGCVSLKCVGDLSEWDTSKLIDTKYMFSGCKSLASVGNLGRWNTSHIKYSHAMFEGCESLTHLGNPVKDLTKYQELF